MEEKKLQISWKTTRNPADFDALHQELLQTVKAIAQNAYAPYSGFHVSAALLLDNDTITKGTNVENASYPVGICAERTVISHTISNYPGNVIRTIAVYVDKDLPTPVPPCGLCRQTLAEAEKRQATPIRLLLLAKNGLVFDFKSCTDLLPLAFDGGYL
jgi:cytidine deaminase